MRITEGSLVAQNIRVGIVASRFNEFITSRLLSGARDALVRRFADATVPGGWLFISHSESLGQNSPYSLVAPAVYRKK